MNVKFIATSVGFTALGAVLGWAFTADAADRKMRDILADNEEMQISLKQTARKNANLELDLDERNTTVETLRANLEAAMNAKGENSPGETLTEIVSGGEIDEVSLEGRDVRQELQGFIDQYAGPDYAEEFNERKVIASTKFDPPFVISNELYAWDDEEGDEYAKITLTWYPNQQVLLDEDSEPIEDVESYVGFQNLNRFGDESDNADVVFVRNRRLETDFEVVRETEEDLPLHVKYALPKVEFEAQRAAGRLRLKETDE